MWNNFHVQVFSSFYTKSEEKFKLNWNMVIMHNRPEFKFNFQTKSQRKFWLKQKLKISKF